MVHFHAVTIELSQLITAARSSAVDSTRIELSCLHNAVPTPWTMHPSFHDAQLTSILAASAKSAKPLGAATARDAALVVTVPDPEVEPELLLLPDPPLTFSVMKLTAEVPLSWTYDRCTVRFWPESQKVSLALQNETIFFVTAAQPELSVRGKTYAPSRSVTSQPAS